MENSWLIQRLRQPTGGHNVFAFGGGFKNGGLTDEAMAIVNEVCSIDYMGAAEFEFGAFQKSLAKMAEEKEQLILGSFEVDYRYDFRGWRDNPSKVYEGKKRVYYLCTKDQEAEVKERIEKWAMKEHWGHTKEAVCLCEAMAEIPKDVNRGVVGWFELDNSFMFFIDEKMWKGACETLFGIKTPSKKQVKKS